MTTSNVPIVPVVLSGGAGTRLWPASRARQPKQLLPLVSDRSMIAATIDRVHAIGGATKPIVVTNAGQATAVQRALRDSGYDEATVILEPVARNTAPAVAVAAHAIVAEHGDALMFVLPADHVITDEAAFADALAAGVAVAEAGRLVTFGITPTSPETGYGYIKAGEPVSDNAREIAEFKEKPDAATAEAYLASGEYSWNSGMFLFLATRYLEELAAHRPRIAAASEAAFAAGSENDMGLELDADNFAACPSESIDYAVMESTDRGAVVAADPGWSDVGSWSALHDIAPKDADGNAFIGDVVAVDTSGSYIRSESRLVATVGLEDVIVVDTHDSVLVASKESVQDVKVAVERLLEAGRPEASENDVTFEPWGTAQLVAETPGHRTVLMTIDPGASIESHEHPGTEHYWQVLEGTASLATTDETHTARPGETLRIGPGEGHRVENRGANVLRMMQVSVDIVVDTAAIREFLSRRSP